MIPKICRRVSEWRRHGGIAIVEPAQAPAPSAPATHASWTGLAFRNIGPSGRAHGSRPSPCPTRRAMSIFIRSGSARGAAVSGRQPTAAPRGIVVRQSSVVAAIGAIAVAPSNGDIVWVGTGDQANARSSYSGRGLYRTLDGGRHWTRSVSRTRHHIARIIIHPTIPTSSTSRRWAPLFDERGARRLSTMDGGRTWKKVLYVDERTGAIDLVIDPSDPAPAVRRDVREAAHAVAADRERPGNGDLSHHERRRHVDAARGGCRVGTSDASVWTSIERIRAFSMRSSRIRIPVRRAAGSSATNSIVRTTAARRGGA
jgi:hypothetical protein